MRWAQVARVPLLSRELGREEKEEKEENVCELLTEEGLYLTKPLSLQEGKKKKQNTQLKIK